MARGTLFNQPAQQLGQGFWSNIVDAVRGVFWDQDDTRNVANQLESRPTQMDNGGGGVKSGLKPGMAAKSFRKPDGSIVIVTPKPSIRKPRI